MHVLRHIHSCEFENRRSIVDVLDQLFYVALATAGDTDKQRCPERLLVHETLVEPAVFTHIEALVGRVDYHRVVHQTI